MSYSKQFTAMVTTTLRNGVSFTGVLEFPYDQHQEKSRRAVRRERKINENRARRAGRK